MDGAIFNSQTRRSPVTLEFVIEMDNLKTTLKVSISQVRILLFEFSRQVKNALNQKLTIFRQITIFVMISAFDPTVFTKNYPFHQF